MGNIAERCLISTSIPRALAAVLVFPAILFAIHLRWVFFGGWPLLDFRHFLHPNEVPLFKSVLGMGCLVVACVRYLPHSFRTIRGGSCALAISGDDLIFYGRTRVSLADIDSAAAVNGLFRKGLIITASGGSKAYISTIMSHNPAPKAAAQTVQEYLQT